MPNRKTTILLCSTMLAAFVFLTPMLRAQEVDTAKALRVKVAYLYNFAKFMEWPEEAFAAPDAPFVIGVLDDDQFKRRVTKAVGTKKISGRSVIVRQFHWHSAEDRAKLSACHLLYIGQTAHDRVADILATIKHEPILTVSDIVGFASHGGMIGFVLEHGRIVFEINRANLKRASLSASAKLLKLAKLVETQTEDQE